MSEAAKLREMMKAKAKRLASSDPKQKVDASSWTPSEPLDADVKTGMRPLSRRAYKKGGKVVGKVKGVANPERADRKRRKAGGEASEAKAYANAKVNRNLKDANELREGKKHVGGFKKGGKAPDAEAEPDMLNKTTEESYRRELEKRQSTEGGMPQASDLYDKQQLERLERGYKKGGRSKKNAGGLLKMLSPIAMLADLAGDDDKDKKCYGGRNKRKSGGRTKRADGGLLNDPRTAGNAILQNSAMASGVPQDMLAFAPSMPSQGIKKFLGLKNGGKAKHSDEAMDKALIKGMVKKGALKDRSKRADGGILPTAATAVTGTTASTAPAKSATTATAANPTAATTSAVASTPRQQMMDRRAAIQKQHAERKEARRAERMQRMKSRNAPAANASDTAKEAVEAAAAKPKFRRSDRYGSALMLPAKKGGRIQKFGGGSLSGMPAQAQGVPQRGPQRAMPTQAQGVPQRGMPTAMPAQAQGVPQGGPFAVATPVAATAAMPVQMQGGMPTAMPAQAQGVPQGGPFAAQQAQAAATRRNAGGRVARKSGGKTKAGKTNINIVIASKAPSDPMGMDQSMPPAPPPGGPAAPPPMGGAPGMPPMPPPPPMGGPGPMMRKSGGKVYRSYKDMDAGAGSGMGRLEKTEIAKRTAHKAGGKVYRSYKDMDAGAGSGMGRLEKTEIQSRKRGS